MTTFLIKTNCELFLNGAEPRPTSADQWEGITISSDAPKTLDGSEATAMQVGDDLIVWTHEHEAYGKGLGLTATARVGAISESSEAMNIVLKDVRLILPPERLTNRPRTGNGSEIIDKLRANHHRRTVEVTDQMVSEFWGVIGREKAAKLDLIAKRSASMPKTAEDQALESDAENIARGFEERFAMVETRPGQAAFRRKLVQLYGCKCLITHVRIEPLLQAAHIVPFSKEVTCRDDPSNGLLLRADIHLLFDRCLFAIRPVDGTIVLSESLKASPYYKQFEGRTVRHEASPKFLARHFEEFRRNKPMSVVSPIEKSIAQT